MHFKVRLRAGRSHVGELIAEWPKRMNTASKLKELKREAVV